MKRIRKGPETAVFRVEVWPLEQKQESLPAAAGQLGHTRLTGCRAARLYFLQGTLSQDEVEQIAVTLLADPVTEEWHIGKLPADSRQTTTFSVEVTLLPGVTDAAADNLVRAAHLLGVGGLERAATGQRYLLEGDLSREAVQQLATGLLANPVIQRFTVNEPITAPLFPYEAADDTVERIPICQSDDDELMALSAGRRLALNLAEMQTIRDYFRAEERDPTDAEIEMLAQTWSEHCVHKTFKATIRYQEEKGAGNRGQGAGGRGQEEKSEVIDGLLRAYIRGATEKINKPWVRSAFVDNAGIIAFDDQFDLAFKVETHNHPSALEPFGGANTGVGGVVRDVLGVSARPIANTNVLCFGPPDLPVSELPAGVLHPRRIAEGVARGIEDYGNKMGIPTVNGAIFYHRGYTANPLVYCGCLGLLPRGSHPTRAQPGDLIVAIGGRTGRDGLRGATFSSMEMDTATGEMAGSAVQIGNPIQEKQVQEVVLRARDECLYTAITDCGAGGFSSAVGEMGRHLGARVQLAAAPLKYPGLRPWEIWLSEAQERMVLAVPSDNWPRLQAVCAGQDVTAVCLGEFEASGRLRLYYGDRLAGDVRLDFLHDGIPLREMEAVWGVGEYASGDLRSRRVASGEWASGEWGRESLGQLLLALLAHPNIRSKEHVIRRYDHEVQGGTAVKPLVGVDNHGPSDAAVLVPLAPCSLPPATPTRAIALSNGICPQFGEIDPYLMAWAAVDEAVRNAVAVGADPDRVAILDNFCWGNPNLPDRLGGLVRCAQGCYDAAIAYQAPFISGKDSLNNEYTSADGEKHAIPGTLLISAVAIVPDVAQTVTMDLKQAGNFLFMVGETRGEMGGSHLVQIAGQGDIPDMDMGAPRPPDRPLTRYRTLHAAIGAGLVCAAHDCSEGGIGVALAEMCLAGRVGARVELMHAPRGQHATYISDVVALFSESLGRLVVEVRPADADRFRTLMSAAGTPHECIGVVGGETLLVNGRQGLPILELPVTGLEQAWRGDWRPAVAASGEYEQTRKPAYSHTRSLAASQPPKVLVLHANGTNRDRDAALACRLAGGQPEIVHVNQLLAGERRLLDYHLLVLPGGFSYGDDLGAGKLWALDLRHRLGEDVVRFVSDGRPVLGICNGFQALVKAGILPGAARPENEAAPEYVMAPARAVTLTFNESGRFECRWVYLQANPDSPCLFTQGMEELIYCPVAHGEGRLAVANERVAALQAEGLIALTYVSGDGGTAVYPANPNGSISNAAGLCNAAGNVLGLMPHPENHIYPWQHPGESRRGLTGLRLFQNGIRAAAG
jgi:phosphoribosylformylglycinamidine synthase II/phosphoribosylformylglycinamidine synthase I